MGHIWARKCVPIEYKKGQKGAVPTNEPMDVNAYHPISSHLPMTFTRRFKTVHLVSWHMFLFILHCASRLQGSLPTESSEPIVLEHWWSTKLHVMTLVLDQFGASLHVQTWHHRVECVGWSPLAPQSMGDPSGSNSHENNYYNTSRCISNIAKRMFVNVQT